MGGYIYIYIYRYWAQKDGERFSEEARHSERTTQTHLMTVFEEASSLAAHAEGGEGGRHEARGSNPTFVQGLYGGVGGTEQEQQCLK
jgi:hypothetical protein